MFKDLFWAWKTKRISTKQTVSAQTSIKNFTELREESIFGYKWLIDCFHHTYSNIMVLHPPVIIKMCSIVPYFGRESWTECHSSGPSKSLYAWLRTSERCFHYWAHWAPTVWSWSRCSLTTSRSLCVSQSRPPPFGRPAAGFSAAGSHPHSSRSPDLCSAACSSSEPHTSSCSGSPTQIDLLHHLNREKSVCLTLMLNKHPHVHWLDYKSDLSWKSSNPICFSLS